MLNNVTRRISYCLCFLVSLACTRTAAAFGTRAVLSVVDFSPYAYACEISDYGNSLKNDAIYRATLMRPPEDPQLCTLPSIALSTDSNISSVVPFRVPVAMMVSLGGCDVHTKLDVALQLIVEAEPSLKYIVFYNNDADNNDGIVSINRPDSGNIPEDIERLSILSVSTSAGVNLMGLLQKYSDATNTSSQLLVEGNEEWDLAMVVQRLVNLNNAPDTPSSYGTSYPRMNGSNFYWLRFVLFTLLILSPCCRGGYLWWNGGGRIRFRRNDNGRIIGLQYVAPVSYWLSSNGAQDTRSPISDRLTPDQVLGLPEIVYKPFTEAKSDANEEATGGSSLALNVEEVDILVSSGSADDEVVSRQPQSPLERATSVSESLRGPDEEQIMEGNFETNFTTCSICIDEFEAGERLRMLPRCKHVFHTQCILPWLTERQGCCPLCKTSVIDPEERGNVEPAVDLARQQSDVAQRPDAATVVPPTDAIAGSVTLGPSLVPGVTNISFSAHLPESIPDEEGPTTADIIEEHCAMLSSPGGNDAMTNRTEPPNVQINYGSEQEPASVLDNTISTEDSQQEQADQAAATIPDIAAEAEPEPSTPSLVETSSYY